MKKEFTINPALAVQTAYAFKLGEGIGYAYSRGGNVEFMGEETMEGDKPFADVESLARALVKDNLMIHYHQPRTQLFTFLPRAVAEAHQHSHLAEYPIAELDEPLAKKVATAYKDLEDQRSAVGGKAMRFPPPNLVE